MGFTRLISSAFNGVSDFASASLSHRLADRNDSPQSSHVTIEGFSTLGGDPEQGGILAIDITRQSNTVLLHPTTGEVLDPLP